MANHNRGIARLPGETTPAKVVKATRSAVEIREEAKRNRIYRERFQAVIERHDRGERGAIHEVIAIGREISKFAHGQDHSLWFAYYDAVRLCWTAPGHGYENRAITPREQTQEASRSYIPTYYEP